MCVVVPWVFGVEREKIERMRVLLYYFCACVLVHFGVCCVCKVERKIGMRLMIVVADDFRFFTF